MVLIFRGKRMSVWIQLAIFMIINHLRIEGLFYPKSYFLDFIGIHRILWIIFYFQLHLEERLCVEIIVIWQFRRNIGLFLKPWRLTNHITLSRSIVEWGVNIGPTSILGNQSSKIRKYKSYLNSKPNSMHFII